MRILMTAPPLADVLSPGGIYKAIREIAKNLTKRGHEVTVLQLNPLNRPNEEFYEGFRIIRVNSRHLYGLSLGMYSYLKKHFKELDPDIVHVHGYHTLLSPEIIFVLKKIMKVKIPIVFSPHFGIYSHNTILGKILWKPYNKIVGQKIVKLVDLIIVSSRFEKMTFQEEFQILSNDKIQLISHGVDKVEINKRNKKNDKDFIKLLYGGYLLKIKGIHYGIIALKDLVYSYNIENIVLKIIGDGPYKKELIRLVEKLNLNKFVEFSPSLEHSQFLNEIKQADVFLYLSEAENYGIAVAEALALGTPVIVTKRTALEEFLDEPGCFGVDYPPDPKEVAKLILKIINSDIKVGPFSKRIRTWDEVTKDYEKLYSDIIKMITN